MNVSVNTLIACNTMLFVNLCQFYTDCNIHRCSIPSVSTSSVPRMFGRMHLLGLTTRLTAQLNVLKRNAKWLHVKRDHSERYQITPSVAMSLFSPYLTWEPIRANKIGNSSIWTSNISPGNIGRVRNVNTFRRSRQVNAMCSLIFQLAGQLSVINYYFSFVVKVPIYYSLYISHSKSSELFSNNQNTLKNHKFQCDDWFCVQSGCER